MLTSVLTKVELVGDISGFHGVKFEVDCILGCCALMIEIACTSKKEG